jgi:dienelactone hydrolase
LTGKLTRRQWLTVCGLPAFAVGSRGQSTVDSEIRNLAAESPLSMQFHGSTEVECKRWQRTFAAKLRELLGPFEPPARWETIRERTVDFDDHARDELVLQAKGHRDLPVYLLTPKAALPRKRPGIVALHGHGAFGYDAVAGIDTSPERRQDIEEQHYDYGVQLVRRGYTVAAPCFTPFGRRLDDPKAYRGQDPCAVTFIRMQLMGQLLMAENLRDALWTLEFLAAQPNVDPARLGCVGLSTGGRMTMLTSALSPRIRVAVISGALNVMQERIGQRYSCGAQVIPGLLKYGDVPEIASLIAPRPCLWEVGLHDELMVKEWIPPALARIQRAYRAFGGGDNLDVDYFDGKHRWNGVKAYPLLVRVLRP